MRLPSQLQQLIEGNARSIQALADSVAADRQEFRDAFLRLTRVQEGVISCLIDYP